MIMNERRSKMAYFTILCTIIFVQFWILSCMGTSEYQYEDIEMMTWYESAAKCSLVANENLTLLDSNYEGWVGGIYLNTSWMTYNDIENNKDLRCAFVNKSLTPELQRIPCNNYQSHNCITERDNNISDLFIEKCILEKTTSSFANTKTKHITNDRQQYTLSTEKEITFVENNSIGYNTTVANNTLLVENYDPVFVIQMGITLGACAMVMLSAIIACCIRIKNRSEENIVIAMEGPPQHTIPITALAENYSDPIDKTSTSNEIEGPRFCATESCQNTNCQRTENGEYQHLDFTLRSEPTSRFADNNEYDYVHGRDNVTSVFEQPWDTATSKVNKLFSQISKSVVQKSQNMRKSLIKRRASRSGSPKLKCRASDYCDARKTQLNIQQFVFDSDADNKSDISIDVANSTIDSSKDGAEFRRTDSAFPVLPYSERINVKSTHIYDEPDDRRMSLRERLLHMISIRPLKMPFGIELDLRGSRSKSKIYSLATPIDETDESVA